MLLSPSNAGIDLGADFGADPVTAPLAASRANRFVHAAILPPARMRDVARDKVRCRAQNKKPLGRGDPRGFCAGRPPQVTSSAQGSRRTSSCDPSVTALDDP